MAGIRTIALPGGETIPALGIGTWNMGDNPRARAAEIAALQTAVDLGMTVIDTAEMYGNGAAEALVADALAHRRGDIFLVSKVLPQNASRRSMMTACENSLRRLKTDRLDLYLLHWRGSVPLEDTLEAFDALVRHGKIRHWGVSNFDVDDMEEMASIATGRGAAVNQVLYNPTRRGIEHDLLPWCRAHDMAVMAYSPLEQGRIRKHKALQRIADRLDATPAQVVLAWILRQPGVMAIPKSAHAERVRENRGALDVELGADDLSQMDAAFPPPVRKIPLEIL